MLSGPTVYSLYCGEVTGFPYRGFNVRNTKLSPLLTIINYDFTVILIKLYLKL